MKRATVTVPWKDGLHLRRSATVVQSARAFSSDIFLKLGGRIADARSILSVMTLAAAMGAVLEIEASGQDEQSAIEFVSRVFAAEFEGDCVDDSAETEGETVDSGKGSHRGLRPK